MISVNIGEFSRAADYYLKNKCYTKAPRKSKDWYEFWREETRRCEDGYKVGDVAVTGEHYFFMNFTPMKVTPAGVDHNKKGVKKELQFPRFNLLDYNWFWSKHIARWGTTEEHLKSLELYWKPNLQDALVGGKHLICAKTRGCGFSYKAASHGVYNYNFIRKSKSFYFASKDPYLWGADGIMLKCWDDLEWLNGHTDNWWRKNRMEIDNSSEKKASVRIKTPQGVEVKGYESMIGGVIVDDPQKVRGARGELLIFEEGGSFRNLSKAIAAAKPLVEDDTVVTGQIIVFGCVCAGTEVYKANGEKVLIENLKQEDGIIGWDGRSVSKEDITWMQPPAQKECVEITLESGKKLRCSDDHPILVTYQGWKANRGNARKIAFIPAKHLDSTYMVGVIEETPFFGASEVSESYTLGYLLGDGYYGGTIEVIVDNEISLNAIKKDCNKIELKRTYSETLKSYSIGGNIRQLVKSNGMWGQSKQEKRFPLDWKDYDEKTLSNFIAGYFDADGNVTNGKARGVRICFSSVVIEILNTLQEALLKFGIHSTIQKELSKGGYTESHTIYRLYVGRGVSVENFRKKIKPLNPKKQIPYQNKLITQVVREAEYHKNKPLGERYEGKLLTGAALYKVKSVVSIGKQDIYNLTAGNTHTYLANNIITHNTGGQAGEDIQGLEDLFYSPESNNFMRFDNVWDENDIEEFGFFVPCTAYSPKFTDQFGNPIWSESKKEWEDKRELTKKSKGSNALRDYDLLIAERPFTPSECFKRVNSNIFQDALYYVNEQIKNIEHNKDVKQNIKHGTLMDLGKGWEFQIRNNAKPLFKYPHNNADDLDGCLSIYEEPYKDNGIIPYGLYTIIVDPFMLDDAEDKTSLGGIYAIKHNLPGCGEGGKISASHVSRPSTVRELYKRIVALAEYYNATIQSEVAGGGQGLIDYLKDQNKLYLAEFAPDHILQGAELNKNMRNRKFFMNVTDDMKKTGLLYFAEYLIQPRGVTADGRPILNVHLIYDLGLLQEITKFVNDPKKNFDRISCMILAMYMFKEKTHTIEHTKEKSKSNFFKRKLFTNEKQSYNGNLDLSNEIAILNKDWRE